MIASVLYTKSNSNNKTQVLLQIRVQLQATATTRHKYRYKQECDSSNSKLNVHRVQRAEDRKMGCSRHDDILKGDRQTIGFLTGDWAVNNFCVCFKLYFSLMSFLSTIHLKRLIEIKF